MILPPHNNILDSILVTSETVAREVLSRCLSAQEADELSAQISITLVGEVRELWGGSPVYIPKNTPGIRAKIYDSYTGNNVRELARRYHFTERSIRRIIAAERERRQRARKEQYSQQANLFRETSHEEERIDG